MKVVLIFKFGSPTWARTRDLRINSPTLYQLSYRGIDKGNCRRKTFNLSIKKYENQENKF